MVEKFEKLLESLKREHPSSDPYLKVLLSGTALLDVRVGPDTYVLACYAVSPDTIVGVERTGVKHTFQSFEEAEAWLRDLFDRRS